MITSSLNQFPECRDVIGRMILAYSEIESILIGTIAKTLDVTESDSVRLLYRARSESHRLSIADAAMRPFFTKHKLGGQFGVWLGAMRHCKTMRNQYAHSIWSEHNGVLRFGDLDGAASSAEGTAMIKFYPVDLDLVTQQETYFAYAESCAWFLNQEACRLRDGRRKHTFSMPPALKQPKLHNRP